jgi:RNA polymerase sigma-70 factor (ECF subfamily)
MTMSDHVSQPRARAAFEEQALCYLDELYGTALRMTRSPSAADDLVQESILRAWKNWHRFKQGTNCRAWVFRILVNTFINGYRRKKTERRFLEKRSPGTLADSGFAWEANKTWSDPELRYEARTLSPTVQEALAGLRPEFRAVVVLADLQDFTYREIAEVVGCPIGTVMSRLFRARRALREVLYEHAKNSGLQVALA